MDRKLKIIYVCPFAHYSGHHPYATTTEPVVLAKNGVNVNLVTFCGITNNPKISVPHFRVIARDYGFLGFFRRWTIIRWFLMAGETVLTLVKAMRLYRKLKCDAIYLRDGEPFLFMSHLLSVPFSGYRWVVSLTGANLFMPKPSMFRFSENPFIYLYVAIQYLMRGIVWKPLYRMSFRRNMFVFVTQNEEAKRGYNECLGGVFRGRVSCVPLGTTDSFVAMSKSESRAKLGLPQNGLILLSFGAPHSGKSIETVIEAVAEVASAFIVHTGVQAFSLGSNPKKLTEKYGIGERTKIFDYYVTEEEKSLFFSAADALMLSYTKAFKSTSSMLWEAAKYGLPVISSNANALGAMAREYHLGLLFEAEDANSLADTIRRFEAIEPRDIERIKDGCVKFAKDYSYDKWVRGCIKVCGGLLR